MSDPSLALQGWLNTTLRASAALRTELGGTSRIYDQPPQRPTFPYVTIGQDQVVEDGADCIQSDDAFLTLHVWSRGKGYVEAKKIVGAIRDAVPETASLTGFMLSECHYRDARYMRDPDGETSHAVVTFELIIDKKE